MKQSVFYRVLILTLVICSTLNAQLDLGGAVGVGEASNYKGSPVVGNTRSLLASSSIFDYYPEFQSVFDQAAAEREQLYVEYQHALNRAKRRHRHVDWVECNRLARRRMKVLEAFIEKANEKFTMEKKEVIDAIESDEIGQQYEQLIRDTERAQDYAICLNEAYLLVTKHEGDILDGNYSRLRWPRGLREADVHKIDEMVNAALRAKGESRRHSLGVLVSYLKSRAKVAKEDARSARERNNEEITWLRELNKDVAFKVEALRSLEALKFLNMEAFTRNTEEIRRTEAFSRMLKKLDY